MTGISKHGTQCNRDLAARARDLAGRELCGFATRAAALCAAVALAESTSIAGAKKVIAGWDGPERIKAAAAELIGDLTRQESP